MGVNESLCKVFTLFIYITSHTKVKRQKKKSPKEENLALKNK